MRSCFSGETVAGDTTQDRLIHRADNQHPYLDAHHLDVHDDVSPDNVNHAWRPPGRYQSAYIQCILVLTVYLPIGLIVYASLIIIVAIIGIAPLPFLWATLVITRFLQFIRRGEDYDHATTFKYRIRWLIFILSILFTILALGVIFSPRSVFTFEGVTFVGLPVQEWVKIIFYICCLEIASFLLAIIIFSHFPQLSVGAGREGSKLNVPDAVAEIFSSVMFWLMEKVVVAHVPAFEQCQILGLYLKDWIQVPVWLLIVYNIITLLAYCFVWLLWKLAYTRGENNDGQNVGDSPVEKFVNSICLPTNRGMSWLGKLIRDSKYMLYFANGVKSSIIFLMSSLVLVLTWILYFGSHLDRTSARAKSILHFGTWTCISLFIFSICKLVKTITLLSWKARVMYNRLNAIILETGKQFYFLGILGSDCDHNVLQFWHYLPTDQYSSEVNTGNDNATGQPLDNIREEDFSRQDVNLPETRQNQNRLRKLSISKKKKIRDELLLQITNPTNNIFCIQQMAQYFLTAKTMLLRKTFPTDILRHLQSNSDDPFEKVRQLIVGESSQDGGAQLSADESSSVEDNRYDWSLFEDELKNVHGAPEVASHQKIRKWLARAHDNCLKLANTLSSTNEALVCANRILNGVLVAAIFIMWLLFTGLATPKLFVIITSPLLAATFIFGETCKNLFQGFIFIFLVHPFDIGDLCVVDGNMMVVRKTAALRTTFSKVDVVGVGEEVIYPNTELAKKVIINHKTELDCYDMLEFKIGSLNRSEIDNLKERIESYLDQEEELFVPNSHRVTLLATEDSMKIVVHFKHKIPVVMQSYYERLKKKEELRFDFTIYVRNLLVEIAQEGGNVEMSPVVTPNAHRVEEGSSIESSPNLQGELAAVAQTLSLPSPEE